MSDLKETAAAKIEAALIHDISAGLLEPGKRLDEATLALRFETSRTPVREALNRLAAQNILKNQGRKGMTIAEYTREELAEMFEAMFEIEAICAKLASQRLTLLARAEIESAQSACIQAANENNISDYIQANEALHLAIYRATKNKHIEEIATGFRRRTGPFRAKKFQSKHDLMQSIKAHEEMILAIKSEDAMNAYNGMKKHMSEASLEIFNRQS